MTTSVERTDYGSVTEQWGLRMPRTQLEMLATRYAFAAQFSEGKDVLEIACGAGLGLEYLAARARTLLAGDVTYGNLAASHAHFRGVPLVAFDAHHLPIRPEVVDVVTIFEALYYFADIAAVLAECRRVIRPGGTLVLSLPNPDAIGFHESPHSTGYLSIPDLRSAVCAAAFTDVEIYGGFATDEGGVRTAILLRTLAAARVLGVVPKDLRGRSRWKRLFYGSLQPFRGLTQSDVSAQPLARLDPSVPTSKPRVLYLCASAG